MLIFESFIPQIGHLPGAVRTTLECIGHVYWSTDVARDTVADED